MSFQTELEQGSHRVLLPSPPFLLEFTYDVCLSGEVKAEPYVVPFAFFLRHLPFPSPLVNTFFFECLLCAGAGHPARTSLVFISLDSTCLCNYYYCPYFPVGETKAQKG